MDNKAFVQQISGELGLPDEKVGELIEALSSVIVGESSEMNSVAIPSFGTFVAVKEDEQIIRDLSTGHRLMMPPSITLKFNPATALKKRVLK